MKGTISPLLRAILADRNKYRRFLIGWDYLQRSNIDSFTIDLGDGESVTLRKHPPRFPKKRRNLLNLLLGR